MPVEDRRGEENDPVARFYGRMKRGVQTYGKLFEQQPDTFGNYGKDIEDATARIRAQSREQQLKDIMLELEKRNLENDDTATAKDILNKRKK